MESKKARDKANYPQENYRYAKHNDEQQEDSGEAKRINNTNKTERLRIDDGSPEDNRRGDARSRYGKDAPE